MTTIRSLPPVLPPPLPSAAPAGSRPAAPTAARDFPALLKAQAPDPVPPPAPANPPAQAAATAMSRRPDIEAMLQQLLACRKVPLHVTGRAGRSASAASTVNQALTDCDVAEDPSAVPACIDEHSAVPCPEHGGNPAMWPATLCGNGLIVGVPVECPLHGPLNLPLTTVGQPASLFIWTPVDIVRTRDRLRRRKRLSAEPVTAAKKRPPEGGQRSEG